MRLENYPQCATQCATQWASQKHMKRANGQMSLYLRAVFPSFAHLWKSQFFCPQIRDNFYLHWIFFLISVKIEMSSRRNSTAKNYLEKRWSADRKCTKTWPTSWVCSKTWTVDVENSWTFKVWWGKLWVYCFKQ